jgi:hypothetical protein
MQSLIFRRRFSLTHSFSYGPSPQNRVAAEVAFEHDAAPPRFALEPSAASVITGIHLQVLAEAPLREPPRGRRRAPIEVVAHPRLPT